MGARTVLIEAARMGGDCLNTGCVPSKALLAAAKAAANIRHAGRFGVQAGEPQVNFAAVNRHVHDVIAGIAPHDSVERFTGLGCTVIQARARFVDERTVEAGDQHIRARRFVVATGSRAAVPPIPGLAQVPFLTNESIFENKVLPEHLIVIGGGPIGCEMAQAHRRLGARVSVLDLATILPKDDPDLVAVVRQALRADGITIEEGAKILKLERRGDGLAVTVAEGPMSRIWAWRRPVCSTARRGSRSISGCAPATGAFLRLATLPAAISSLIWPAIMPASCCATRCSACPPRSIPVPCRG
jgi:pyruvate/2-oxoglutarate dehydrogenase complex dihydrolipoamide dehydrogenase (E3) component